MNTLFEKLLSLKNFGKIVFDENFHLLQINPTALKILRLDSHQKTSITLFELFPEFYGCEKTLAQLFRGKKNHFELNFVNRIDDENQNYYLNLLAIADPEHLQGILIVEEVSEKARFLQQMRQQRHELSLYQALSGIPKQLLSGNLIGNSPKMQDLKRSILKLSKIPGITILLTGESGTGKNLVARIIHQNSLNAEAPFIEINCAAIPENLIESELFGFEKGAFTHAIASKPGLFEEAEEGTIFLDEIGDLPLNLQSKLLSVLESKKFRRLGSTREIKINARFIAATNKDLSRQVEAGKFREDLYHRLNFISIALPPLRELGNDIILLGEYFIKIYNFEFKKNVKGFTPQAKKHLREHFWPGNVRELSNCLERALIFSEKDFLEPSDLLIYTPPPTISNQQWQIPLEGISLEEVEKKLILSALEQSKGNKSKAARLLGLSRDTLRYRLEKLHLL